MWRKTTYAVCVAWFLCATAFAARPDLLLVPVLLLTGVLLLAVFIASTVKSFTQWKLYRLRAIFPFAACLVAFFTPFPAGILTRRMLFKWRLPRYEALVEKIESGKVPVPPRQMIPKTEYDTSLAIVVKADRNTNGVLTVEFLYAGSAVGHLVYVYSSSGVLEKHWWSQKKLADKWFEVVD